MKYDVVKVTTYEAKFIETVNARIEEGWRPIGGVSAVTHQGSGMVTYYQAMVNDGHFIPLVDTSGLNDDIIQGEDPAKSIDFTEGAFTLAKTEVGDRAYSLLLSLESELGRRVTKADVRRALAPPQDEIENAD